MKSTCSILFSSADRFYWAGFSLLYQLSVPAACWAAEEPMGGQSHKQESWEHEGFALFTDSSKAFVDHQDDFWCFWISPMRRGGIVGPHLHEY